MRLIYNPFNGRLAGMNFHRADIEKDQKDQDTQTPEIALTLARAIFEELKQSGHQTLAPDLIASRDPEPVALLVLDLIRGKLEPLYPSNDTIRSFTNRCHLWITPSVFEKSPAEAWETVMLVARAGNVVQRLLQRAMVEHPNHREIRKLVDDLRDTFSFYFWIPNAT